MIMEFQSLPANRKSIYLCGITPLQPVTDSLHFHCTSPAICWAPFFYLPLSSLAISLIANSRQYCQQQQQPNIPINTNFTLPQCQQPQKQQKLQENSAKFFFYLWLQTWTATTTGELLRTKKGGTYRKRGKQGLFLA